MCQLAPLKWVNVHMLTEDRTVERVKRSEVRLEKRMVCELNFLCDARQNPVKGDPRHSTQKDDDLSQSKRPRFASRARSMIAPSGVVCISGGKDRQRTVINRWLIKESSPEQSAPMLKRPTFVSEYLFK